MKGEHVVVYAMFTSLDRNIFTVAIYRKWSWHLSAVDALFRSMCMGNDIFPDTKLLFCLSSMYHTVNELNFLLTALKWWDWIFFILLRVEFFLSNSEWKHFDNIGFQSLTKIPFFPYKENIFLSISIVKLKMKFEKISTASFSHKYMFGVIEKWKSSKSK